MSLRRDLNVTVTLSSFAKSAIKVLSVLLKISIRKKMVISKYFENVFKFTQIQIFYFKNLIKTNKDL